MPTARVHGRDLIPQHIEHIVSPIAIVLDPHRAKTIWAFQPKVSVCTQPARATCHAADSICAAVLPFLLRPAGAW